VIHFDHKHATQSILSTPTQRVENRFANAILVATGGTVRLHSVAFENPAASLRQSAAILLEALLHGRVVAEVISTKMRSVPRAGALFLGRAGMLCQSDGWPKQHQHQQCKSGHR
jgi:hypothetical protein